MSTLSELARAHTRLNDADLGWLRALTADWQIIADLSFADLVLWLVDAEGSGFWAVAQIRPTTGPTAYLDDIVATFASAAQVPILSAAESSGRVIKVSEFAEEGSTSTGPLAPALSPTAEAIPVVREERLIAVISRSANSQSGRAPSRLEHAYLHAAKELSQMIANGEFPFIAERSDRTDSPRVGDGFVRVDQSGVVGYASPNAQSVYRRLGFTGDLTGQELARVTRELVPYQQRVDEDVISSVLGARRPLDVEVGNTLATVVLRSIPLREHGKPVEPGKVGRPAGKSGGGIVLLRDVTELRRRESELVTKDATIREIHHRVKNNLQTVAALLRLQGRRISSPEGKEALVEAERRVGAIAVVHDTLSQTLDEWVVFDEICDQICKLVVEVGTPEGRVTPIRQGSFGTLPSEVATPLAMVLTELLQNTVQHAFMGRTSGEVVVSAERFAQRLEVAIIDDGVGLPTDFEPGRSLGLSIVTTLIGEMDGRVSFGPAEGGGTVASLSIQGVGLGGA